MAINRGNLETPGETWDIHQHGALFRSGLTGFDNSDDINHSRYGSHKVLQIFEIQVDAIWFEAQSTRRLMAPVNGFRVLRIVFPTLSPAISGGKRRKALEMMVAGA